ncbi:GNAT family protein [Paenibacillus sp. JCM 10914]
MFPVIETERLVLREVTQDDMEAVYRCFSSDDVTRYYGQDSLTDREQARQIIAFFHQSYVDKRGVRWGIQRKEQPELIGTIGFNAWSPKHKRAEIGYELHPSYWHQGYAREAASAVIAHGFEELGLTRIGAIVFLENESSHALLTTLGFTSEGVLRQYMVQNGVSFDTRVYSLLKPSM